MRISYEPLLVQYKVGVVEHPTRMPLYMAFNPRSRPEGWDQSAPASAGARPPWKRACDPPRCPLAPSSHQARMPFPSRALHAPPWAAPPHTPN